MGGYVEYEDFAKLELRVGRVVSAERVPGSRKLLRLIVDVGGEERQVIAGIARWYDPEDLVGKNVVVVSNLKPKRIAGIVSQGMILATGCEGGEDVAIITPERPVPSGTKVC